MLRGTSQGSHLTQIVVALAVGLFAALTVYGVVMLVASYDQRQARERRGKAQRLTESYRRLLFDATGAGYEPPPEPVWSYEIVPVAPGVPIAAPAHFVVGKMLDAPAEEFIEHERNRGALS